MRLRVLPFSLHLLILSLLVAKVASSGGILTAGSLFREASIQQVAVNPAGTLVAASVVYEGTRGILVQDMKDGFKAPVFLSKDPFRFAWADDDTIFVSISGEVDGQRVFVDLSPNEWDLAPEEHRVLARGWVVDPLPLVENEVLWATWTPEESSVYRAPLSEIMRPSGPRDRRRGGRMLSEEYRVARISDRISEWVSDHSGVPRAAMVVEDDDPLRFELRYRDDPNSRWRTIGSWEGEEVPELAGIAGNGHDLLVLSDDGRDTVALREYLVDEKRFGALLYANPQFDLSGVIWDYQGYEVIAAVYEEGGLLRYHHLDVDESQQQRWIQSRFPDTNAILTSRTADRRFATAFVTGPRHPGTYYFMDAEEQTLVAIAEAMPWLSRSELVDVESFEVETKDGLKVESFLALPKTREGELPPLLVMPHGGPIGVRDTRGFDPTVQYFASNGFAVLQVNYRGSAGRGSSFLEAGKQAWGREIEDDIETAVDHLVAQGRADKNRMCIFGSSYGGYSALISTTRRPQRYKCAVAFAAPTDLLLLFDGELAQDDETRDLLTEIVGDPDRDELIRTSPAYRAAEMDTPILLIYGQDDRRVDVEHGHRMRVMLELHEKSHEWMLLEGTDHSPDSKQWIRIIVRVARFLREHLIQ